MHWRDQTVRVCQAVTLACVLTCCSRPKPEDDPPVVLETVTDEAHSYTIAVPKGSTAGAAIKESDGTTHHGYVGRFLVHVTVRPAGGVLVYPDSLDAAVRQTEALLPGSQRPIENSEIGPGAYLLVMEPSRTDQEVVVWRPGKKQSAFVRCAGYKKHLPRMKEACLSLIVGQ